MDPSRSRLRSRSAYEKMGKRLTVAIGRSTLLAASPYTHRIKCGKAGCKCGESEYRHEMDCISYQEEDKSRTRVIPKGKKTPVVKMTQAYKQYKKARREMKDLFEEMLSEMDKVAEHRCALGMKRFNKFCEDAKSMKSKAHKGGK